jgi:hypothetical protein
MKQWFQHMLTWANKPISAAPAAMFRVLFGLLMAFNTVRFWYFGWIEDHFVAPTFHFTYFGFDWVQPLPEFWMYALHVVAFIAAILIMLGWFYRWATIIFFLLFTYFELIDLTYYLNHYYFISLMSGMIIFLPLNRYFSLDVNLGRVSELKELPQWPLRLIQFQIAVVYVYAGLAKLNYDWLFQALPLRMWLPANSDMPVIGWLFNYPETCYAFSWAGMLYDTFIVFFLMWRRTRLIAYTAVLFFHGVTAWLFQIGVFPLVMSVIVLVFFSPEFHQRIIDFLRGSVPSFGVKRSSSNPSSQLGTAGLEVILLFIGFQILFPWRFVFYPGSMYWTEEAYRFGWRVMLVEKAGTAQFFVKDGNTGKEGEVYNREFLNAHQEKQMSFQPDMIIQFAHHLKEVYEDQGLQDVSVRCETWVTLNGRPSQLLFDPQLDLTKIEDSWAPKTWINPLMAE